MTVPGARVPLPSGYWVGEVHHREVALRPLNGADQEYLCEAAVHWLPVDRTTAILTRCITQMEGIRHVTSEVVGQLTIGDREALVLHLRRLTLGERIQCVLTCPRPACGNKVDLDLSVRELLLPPYAEPRPLYETTVENEAGPYHAWFRLPTGTDQAEAAWVAQRDPQAAAKCILKRCLTSMTDEGDRPVETSPPGLLDALAQHMADLDPQAELLLHLTCPHCGLAFSTVLDTAAYFFQETAAQMDALYREVHALAFHYHWSESEIMDLTPRKRHRYLNLLLDALSEGAPL